MFKKLFALFLLLGLTHVTNSVLADAIRPGFDTTEFSANDDDSVNVSLEFTVNYFGTDYSDVYVNNNGNLTFGGALETYTAEPLNSAELTVIAPFWADVDTRDNGSGILKYGTGTVNDRLAFGATWIDVGYFDSKVDKLNSFQVILIDRSDLEVGYFDIELNYRQIQWETGDAVSSGGSNGLGGSSARVGYSNGKLINVELPGSSINGAFLDGGENSLVDNSHHSPVAGRYYFQVRDGIVDGPLINEVDYAQPGNPDSAEFIELKNLSVNPINLKDYSIQLVDDEVDNAVVYKTIDLPDVMLATSDYYVICTNNTKVANCDFEMTPTTTDLIQNGPSDAVALVLDGTVIDTVGYESSSASTPYTEGSGEWLDDDGEQPYLALSRFPDGYDTNQNDVDFSLHCTTPGVANIMDDSNCYELSIDNVTMTEGNAGTISAQFTVSLSKASFTTVSVDYATADGTTLADNDYVAIDTTTLSFAPGELNKTITVTVNSDTLYEGTCEQFFVNLSNPVNAAIVEGQGVGTITDDDVPPTVSITDVTVTEGDMDTVTAQFTISVVNLDAASGLSVTVDYATGNDTATAGNDYVAVNNRLTFAPGDTSKTINLTVNGDALDEGANERFFVNLNNPVNATIADAQGVGTISDDDDPPTISINDVRLNEGNTGTTSADFTVSLSAASGLIIGVDYTTGEDSATENSDYLPANSTLSLAPGETSKTVSIVVKGDTLIETDERFFVNLSTPVNATIADNQGFGIIRNDDFSLLINEIDYDQPGETDSAEFIELKNVSLNAINLDAYELQLVNGEDGTATVYKTIDLPNVDLAAGDYYVICADNTKVANCDLDGSPETDLIQNGAPDAVALFLNGVVIDTVSYEGNTIAPYTETSGTGLEDNGSQPFLGLSRFPDGSNTNQNHVDLSVRCTTPGAANIEANAKCYELSIDDITITEGNAGTISAQFTVSLSNASFTTVSVDYVTADGTTLADNDYVAIDTTTLSFAPGEFNKTITVTVNSDVLDEGASERFFVNLSNPVFATIVDNQGEGTITDDDPPPTLSIDDVTVAEGEADDTVTAQLTVSLSAASGLSVTVDYATANDTATAGNDYVAVNNRLTFAPGDTSKTINLTVNGDALDEGANERFFVNLNNPVNATIADAQGVGTISDDDDPPTISINDVRLNEGNTGTTSADFTVSLSAASGLIIGVDYTTGEDSATENSDYLPANSTLSLAPGETSKTVSIVVNGDAIIEEHERFFVNLTTPVNVTMADNQGFGLIINDDVVLVINEIDYDQLAGTDIAEFIELKNVSTRAINLDPYTLQLIDADAGGAVAAYQNIDLPATTLAAGDYYVICADNTKVAHCDLDITPDTDLIQNGAPDAVALVAAGVVEEAVSYEGNIGRPYTEGSAIGLEDNGSQPFLGLSRFPDGSDTNQNHVDLSVRCTTPGAANIEANAKCYELSIDDVTVTEGHSGTTTAQFTVNLNRASVARVTVDVATVNNTAIAGSDHTAVNTTLAFAPGETSKTVDVIINGDLIDEGASEQFFVNLSNPVFATIVDNQGGGTITDDDDPPTLSITDVTVSEGHSGTVAAQFTVSLDVASGLGVTVDYATTDDTATVADNDYVAVNATTLSFAPGETGQTVNVTIIGDTQVEGANEQFFVNLSNPVNATIADEQGIGIITNDDTKPEISDIQFEGNPLTDGGTISQSGTIRLTANDGFGIGRVEFYLDGTLFHTDSNGSTQYSAFLLLTAVTDGTHTLEIKAYNTVGNVSSTTLTVSVALAAPTSTPVITQPVNGLVTNQTQITVTGSAEPGTDVVLSHNGTEVGSPLSLDDNNTFSTTVTLQSGPNELQVAARNRGGMGPLSSTTQITLDSSVPDAPGALLAEAQADGQVRLTWQATDNDIAGYDVYRASQSFTALSEAQKVNSETVTGTRFNDLVVTDGRYYYRVVAVNTVGTASALSNEVSVSADATPPRVTLIEYTPALTTYTQGRIDVTVTVSEPLLTTPFLTMVPDGGIPIAVELTPVTDTQYQGHFEITGFTPSGTAYAVFSARDLAGNRGTEIDAGVSINIDSDGPFITKITLSPAEPIRNDQTNPVTVQVSIELNEALPTGKVPELSYRLSGAGRSAEAITPLTQKTPLIWSASFSLPADAGLNENETLYFIFNAADELGNVGQLIQPDNLFQVYQDELPPLTVPFGLVGTALPGGRVQLSWQAVTAATDYQLFRQAPGETELSPYQRSGGTLTLTDETKPQDGLYHYAVASVRSANAQESLSAYSNIVKVTADSTAPAAPTNLQLELVGAGIRASWIAPTGNEALSYQLYRSAEDIVSVTGLTPHQSEIAEPYVIDTSPSKSEAYYAVVAIDAAGNQSPLSDSAYLNVELLPIATLTVVQEGDEYPVLSWSHAATDMMGFDLYLGSEAERIQVNASPLTETTYTDSGYNQQERIYTVVALDSNAVESPARTLVLPKLSVELQQTTPIRRAQFNTLAYQVTNHTAHVVTDIAVQVQLGNHAAHSEPFALTAGETKNVPVVVGGYADLADLSALVTTLEIRPDSGEVAQIIRRQTVEIAEGSSLAISLQSQQLTRGSDNGQVKFRAENTSAVDIDIVVATASGTAASDEIQFMLLDADDNVLSVQAFQQALGKHVIALANGKTVARIPAGSAFESDWITLPVPSSAPSQVYLKLAIANIHYQLGKTEALSIAGMETRQAVALIDTRYYGEITNITPATSYGDDPIVITGNARERTTSNTIPLVPLQVVINLQGFERSYPVYTDQNGAFSYTFTPLATESGTYKVSAVHPDLTERPEQRQFVIQRIELSATSGSGSVDGSDYTVDLRIPFNYEQRIDVPVIAGASTQQHNVHLIYEAVDQPLGSLPSGVQVNLGNALSVLNAEEKAQLSFTVQADNAAEPSGTLILKVMSDERGDTPIGRVIVNYQLSSARPALYASPSIIETGVNLDSSVTETLTLENQGLAALTGLTVKLLNENGTMAPGWIYLTTQEALGTLAIGDKRDIQLMASPSTSVSEGDYIFIVRASGDNHAAALDTYVSVTVTQAGIGHVLFKAADIYTATLDDQGNVIEGLAGAEIHIQNEKVSTVEKTLTTDNVGEALFSDLPAGRYKFKATAGNHQEVIGRFRIKPGVTISERVFLDYNLVTVEWSVTETTVEDRYEITLNATYETDVPAAVVIVEPMSVNLPDMQPGEVFYGELTLTNYGLIRADDLKFDLPSDQYFKYELLGDLPISLGAKERITIPYRVTALKALEQGADGSGGGCRKPQWYLRITYTYKCADGDEIKSSSTTVFSWIEGECPTVVLSPSVSSRTTSTNCDECNSPPSQPTPSEPAPKPIDGVKCWLIAERWDEIDDCGKVIATIRNDSYEKVGSSVSLVQREFNDKATDISVKVQGGQIAIERRFYANAWHWQYTRNKLHFNWNVSGDYLASIEKDGVIYRLFVDSADTVWDFPANPVYVKDNAKILKLADGYRWQSLTGKWKEYDSNGRMTAFGTRQGTLGKLLYQDTDPNSSAIGIADRNDRQVIWFEYNSDGLLSAARDLGNRRVEYRYTGEHLTGVKDVLGQETVYEYSSQGYLIKKVDTGGRITQIEYDSYGHPTVVLDENGEGTFFAYDYDASKKEYYARITTSAGKVKEVWYNSAGGTKRVDINGRTVKTLSQDQRDILITDEKGNVTRRSFDEWGNFSRVVYPDNSTASFEYEHRFNRLVRAMNRRGYVTKYQYDDYGNLVQQTEAAGTEAERVTALTYDEQHQLITITVNGDTEAEAASTHLSYDGNGNIASLTYPLGNTVEFRQYDAMGNPSEIKDARGFIWRMNYDALGRLVSITDPLNQTRTYEYDGANNNTAVVDEAQNRFESVYNKHNRITKAIDPLLNEILIIYNSDQLPVEVIDEAGKKGVVEYDNEGRLKRYVDGAGNEIVPHYDDTQASLVSSYLPAKIEYPTYTQQLYYDKLQRLVRTTEVLETNTRYSANYTYDAADNVVKEIDQQGNTTHYEYDALNRLTKITDALNGVTELSYDTRDNVTAVTDGNNGITRYEYDKNNNLVKLIRPMGEVTQYQYDAANNQTARLDAKGQKIAYLYDALDRLTQVDYYAATDHSTPVKTVRFSYDALGNLLSYEDGTTSASYSYDALQRKLSETVNYGSFVLSHRYDYYANGLKKAFTGPDGVKIVYEYDNNNRLSAIDIPDVGRVTYNTYQWNSPAKITLPGGSQIELAYDPLMRLQSQVSQDAAKNVITRADYEHSSTDQVRKKTTEDGEYTYQYDDVYHLTNASHPVLDNESYSYDLVGNRLTAAKVPEGASYNANNALISYGESAFEHDANGNLVKQTLGTEVRHYVYDVEDRLVRVEDGSGNTFAEYYYDPFGRRLWKKVSGVKTYFGYADEGLIGEYDENGVETKAYGYAPDSLWTTNPLFQKTGGTYYWYQNDHLGTSQKLLDNAGNVVWAAYYEAFGHAQIDVALIENNLRFPGQYYDVETGLHYNWHRYYDPIGGRYLSTDPILFHGQEGKLYRYVLNDPVNLIDPNGQFVFMAIVGRVLAGALAGSVVNGIFYAIFEKNFTWGGLGASMLGGAVAGGLGAVAPSGVIGILSNAGIGVLSAGTITALDPCKEWKDFNPLSAAAFNSFGGFIGKKVATRYRPNATKIENSVIEGTVGSTVGAQEPPIMEELNKLRKISSREE